MEREKGLEPSTSTLATRQSLQLLCLLELRGLVNYYLKMRNRVLVLIALVLFPACASVETLRAERQSRLEGRVGKSVEDLIAEVGPPTRSLPKGPPGEVLYVYEWGAESWGCSVTYSIAKGRVTSAAQAPRMEKYCF